MRPTAALVVTAAALLAAGCASGRTRTVDLSYAPPARSSASGAATTAKRVAVATFVDARKQTDRIGFTRAASGDVVYVPKGGSLAEAVTEAVVARLKADGYTVARLGSAWDPRKADIPSAGGDLVVGGLVEEFYGESNGNAIWSASDAGVRLRVAVASPGERRIIGQSLIRSNLDGTTTSASLPANLRERFLAAVEQVTLAPGLESSLSGAR